VSLTLLRQFGVVGPQGLPVNGFRRFGVPTGGAFDQDSLALANALAGNGSVRAAWELSMAQATFRAEKNGLVGVAGAVAAIQLRGERLTSGVAFSLEPGEEFTVEAPTVGARVYVAESSMVRPSGWRIRLEGEVESVAERHLLRVVAGPQSESFDSRVLSWPFAVSQTGNRVGVRLEPSVGVHPHELPSEPQCVGTIQVSNDGTLIILGPDGPTIGGYPKIAVVATCDIPRLAQLQPGEKVRFEFCTIEQARESLISARSRLDRRLRMLRLSSTI